MQQAVLHGTLSEPDGNGDHFFTFEDKLRGKSKVRVHIGSPCLGAEHKAPAKATAPGNTTPAGAVASGVQVPGPEASKKDLMTFCRENQIAYRPQYTTSELQAVIRKHFETPPKPAEKPASEAAAPCSAKDDSKTLQTA